MMTLEDLGRHAVACKHWRWMDGSKRVHPEHRWAWRLVGWRWFPCDERSNAVHDDVFKESLPDLSDPCTLGGLLALVREAWSDTGLCISGEHDCGVLDWAVLPGKTPTREFLATAGIVLFTSEAEALVAALEAAP